MEDEGCHERRGTRAGEGLAGGSTGRRMICEWYTTVIQNRCHAARIGFQKEIPMSKHILVKIMLAGLFCSAGLGSNFVSRIHAVAAQHLDGATCHVETVAAVTRNADRSIDLNAHHVITITVCPIATPSGATPDAITGSWRGWIDLSTRCFGGQGASADMDTNSAGSGSFIFTYYNLFLNVSQTDEVDSSWGGGASVTAQDPGGMWREYSRVDFYSTSGVSFYTASCY